MKIWIDADASPIAVKQIVFRAAKRLQIETLLVANRSLPTPNNLPLVRSIVVGEGADQADRFIVANAAPGDVAITADIPLAAQLVERGLHVIDPRGDVYTSETIQSRLSMRNFMDDLRGAGVELGGNRAYSDQDKKAFAAALDRWLRRAIESS